ncbi:MAG TPA: hypothetical protein VFP93_01655, partial [Gammaproteobacteria bacterium]|nr:hypothetical protein [Gammaproteobacteria bacterium]
METQDKLQPALGFEEILDLDESVSPASSLTPNKPYHEIEEFLNLTWEELFLEPVYVEEEEEEEVAFGEEGFVESEFLDLDFEDLFNIPVRLTRLDMNNNEDTAAGKVQSGGGKLAKLKKALSQNDMAETQTSDRGDIELTPLSDITISSEFLPPPTDIPTNAAPFAPLFYLGALQERTGQVQTIVDNIFRLPSSLGANLYDSLIPHGGDGSPNITLFIRPDSSQTKTTMQGSSKITITTSAGNTLEFYTADEGQHKFGDYIYTLKNPVFHDDAQSNIPHEFEDDGDFSVIDSNRDNKPTVEEITNALKQGFANGNYPDAQ